MDIKNLIPSFGRKDVPVRRDEEHPFAGLQREMNRLFEGFLQGWGPDPFPDRFGAFSPRIDVTEDDKTLKVIAELPGIAPRDIDISLSRDSLTIRGEKKDERENRKENYFYSERSFGSFARTIRIPREIEVNKVQADFKKGILTITMPKAGDSVQDAKKITVKAE